MSEPVERGIVETIRRLREPTNRLARDPATP